MAKLIGVGQRGLIHGPALALTGLFYAWLLTKATFTVFGAEALGLTFNSMLDHMLHGRWDVDPAAIGFEAFVKDGRSYAYFGPFPGLLRLPLLLVPHRLLPDWRVVQMARLSCWLAIMLGVASQYVAVTGMLAEAPRAVSRSLSWPLIMTCSLSGAPMLLGVSGALLYHEPILWAWALAMLFIAVSLPLLAENSSPGWQRYCVMAICAGSCLLTRGTTGAGLMLAVGLLLVRELCRNGMRWRQWLSRHLWLPLLILAAFAVLTGFINLERWGSPFTFADLRLQTIINEAFPGRIARLQRHGLFDPHRLDLGILYYVFPVWTRHLEQVFPLRMRLSDWLDAAEMPASSLLLTDPVWCLLAAIGMVAICRKRATLDAALLAAGLSFAPLLILMAWYLAFRYRIEFSPLLVGLSCIGLRSVARGVAEGRAERMATGLAGLCALQVIGAGAAGLTYAHAPFGPSPGYQAFALTCTVHPAACNKPANPP